MKKGVIKLLTICLSCFISLLCSFNFVLAEDDDFGFGFGDGCPTVTSFNCRYASQIPTAID